MLKFGKANDKTKKLYKVKELKSFLTKGKKVYNFDLLAGFSCPFADKCLTKAIRNPKTGKTTVWDGPNTEFRCFAASGEARLPDVYNAHKHNFDLLRKCSDWKTMFLLISQSIPKNAGVIRVHSSGDFFNPAYMRAWIAVANNNPSIHFYAYTKSIQWALDSEWPTNFVVTGSFGGKQDAILSNSDLRTAKVVNWKSEAKELGLEIDDNDSHAAIGLESFALLIHSTQKAGTEASKSVRE